jgi:predicted HTH transcriptional regulator
MQKMPSLRSARDLLEELNSVDESTRIEAKRASESGKSVMQTVIAFANEPGLEGGYLLLGTDWFVNEKGDTVYRAVGLPDPDKVQLDLASQCTSMLNVVIRPEMLTETIDGKTVLVVHIPEADVTQKPVYLKATGLPRGYTVHSPTQIIRYSNRIEIRNVGYSLKDPTHLGSPGSRLRNPVIAAVLHDLNIAEAKGTGIRAMRRLAVEAG